MLRMDDGMDERRKRKGNLRETIDDGWMRRMRKMRKMRKMLCVQDSKVHRSVEREQQADYRKCL